MHKKHYLVSIEDEDCNTNVAVRVPAYKASRAMRWVLKNYFLRMNTEDDQSIYRYAPLDNTVELIRYLAEARIYASVVLEKMLLPSQKGGPYEQIHIVPWKGFSSRPKRSR